MTLAALSGEWLTAEDVRSRLEAMGFTASAQQVSAWLRRLARLDLPPVEVRTAWWGGREYRATRWGHTWIRNLLPWTQIRGLSS